MVLAGMLRGGGLPKEMRGLRCRRPFCDFWCVREECANLSDLGEGGDVDEETVRRVVPANTACMQTRPDLHAGDWLDRRAWTGELGDGMQMRGHLQADRRRQCAQVRTLRRARMQSEAKSTWRIFHALPPHYDGTLNYLLPQQALEAIYNQTGTRLQGRRPHHRHARPSWKRGSTLAGAGDEVAMRHVGKGCC